MPIPFTCPHCGKQFSVAEHFAGQTGPCAACNQPITIPGKPVAAYAVPPTSGGMGGTLLALFLGLLGLMVVCGGILLALLLPAFQSAREAARRSQATNHARQILLAIHNYHDTYGSLPPAVVTDAAGQPLYSGRVLLLPFLEQEALYRKFDLDKAWDSPENLPLSQTTIPIFMDPSSPLNAPGQTNFVFASGKGTAFEAGQTTKLMDIVDGTSNTMAIVEFKNSGISWAEPKDLDISQPMSLPPGNHPGGNIVGFADGSSRFLSSNVPPTLIRDLATKAGQEASFPP